MTVSEKLFTDGFLVRAHSEDMNKYKSPFKHFDMPTTHLPEDGPHYTPAWTRDSTERDRRHGIPHGSLILEEQSSGLLVARQVIVHDYKNPEDQEFAFNQLVPALSNTSFYSGAAGAGDVMRRRRELPEFASDEGDGWRQTKAGLLVKTQKDIAYAATLASQLELAHKRGTKAEALRRQLGAETGKIALALACWDLGDAPESMSAYDIQAIVRLRALDTIQQSRQFMPQQTYGSLAQLARSSTPLARHWMQHAPHSDEAAEVLAAAQEDFGLAA